MNQSGREIYMFCGLDAERREKVRGDGGSKSARWGTISPEKCRYLIHLPVKSVKVENVGVNSLAP